MKPALLRDLQARTWWHGGRARLEAIDWKHPLQGGLHLGTLAQAQDRGKVLTAFRLYPGQRLRRVVDRADGWVAKARDARSRGFDALLYLNRHEGLPPREDLMDHLAYRDMPDSMFARREPHAAFSLLVLRTGVVRALDAQATLDALAQERTAHAMAA